MENNGWRTAAIVLGLLSAVLVGEVVTVRDAVLELETMYSAFANTKLKNGKTIGQMIRPGSVGVFESNGRAVICGQVK